MTEAVCNDCKKDYSEFGLDLVLPHDQWEIICPEDGFLCANCISVRASKLKNSVVLRTTILFRKDYGLEDK